MTRIQRQVYFSGRVQGVGFRYNAARCAKGLGVTGFVRNLSDGRVELVAEGTPEEVDRLLADVRQSMEGNIHSESTHDGSPTGEYTDFSIRH